MTNILKLSNEPITVDYLKEMIGNNQRSSHLFETDKEDDDLGFNKIYYIIYDADYKQEDDCSFCLYEFDDRFNEDAEPTYACYSPEDMVKYINENL